MKGLLTEEQQIRLLTIVVQDLFADTGAAHLEEVLEAVGEASGWKEMNTQRARVQRAGERVALMRQYRKAKEAAAAPMTAERWLRRVEDSDTLRQLYDILKRLPFRDTGTEWTRGTLKRQLAKEMDDRIPF